MFFIKDRGDLGKIAKFLLVLVAASTLTACHDDASQPMPDLDLADLVSLRDSSLHIDEGVVRKHISRLMKSDGDSTLSDFRLRAYYGAGRPLLWVDRLGTSGRADTLLSFLGDIPKMGFSSDRFRIGQIERDLQRVRALDFNSDGHDISRVLARLEYNLTKAYFTYAAGQGYGFVNPRQVLNHFDVKDSDSVHVEYNWLFDIPMTHVGNAFYEKAARKVSADSVGEFLRALQPDNPYYGKLLSVLNSDSLGAEQRTKVLCNLERYRWRLDDQPYKYRKFVLVNIPSYRLYAVDGDSVLSMRVGCGAMKTKTPLLTSRIHRMEINPQWVIPRSIVEKDIVRHVGDRSYFDRHRYFVRSKRTGKRVDFERVTWGMLMDKNYMVVQEGGAGNSLGRIIFRFDNNFSVFLHDTSSPGFFSRDNRGVSHGCVRVQRPFDLAVFLLGDKDEKIIDKINYSMHADVSSLGNKDRKPEGDDDYDILPLDTLDRSRIIGSYELKENVPVFLAYYTLLPDQQGVFHPFADVYGYDRAIYKNLKQFVK